MNRNKIFLYITGLFIIVLFLNCTPTRHYDFTLKNTLSIFLLNDRKDYYFSIPVQYIGDYQVENFEFNNGYILIGDYEILLDRDNVSIDMLVNESSDELPGLNQYDITVEYTLKNNEIDNIINEYEKGNTYSKFYLGYTITIDDEQMECGYLDDFELYNEEAARS